MNDIQRRIARARLLRRTGKTYDEIRAALGVYVSNDSLQAWLRGIPRPPETRRSHPKRELRQECRRLRATGMTCDQIAAFTGASAGSLSLWLRDMRPPQVRRRLAARPPRRDWPYARAARASAEAVRAKRRTVAAQALGSIADRELLTAGVALYLAEGSKAKPWRPRDRQVVFMNSDPTIIVVFLAWLDMLGVEEARRSYRLSIHETANVASHEAWWAATLNLEAASFRRATLKKHKPVTVRKNTNSDYHGCLTVRVAKPAALYDAIEGWWQRLVCMSTALRADSVGCSVNDPGWSNGRTRRFGRLRWGFESSPGSS